MIVGTKTKLAASVLAILLFAGFSCLGPGDSAPPPLPRNTYEITCSCDLASGLSTRVDIRDCADDIDNMYWRGGSACLEIYKKSHGNDPYLKALECTVLSARETHANVCQKTSPLGHGARPKHATVEGPIDFHRSFLSLEIPKLSDRAQVKLKGEISVVGGNCPGQECPIEIWHARLEPVDNPFATDAGHEFKDMLALNEGVWTGTKHADDTFTLSPNSYLALSSRFDGKLTGSSSVPNTYFNGRFLFGQHRAKEGGNAASSNAIVIDGDFLAGEMKVRLRIHTWMADCRPRVEANAQCWGGVDGNQRYLQLTSDYGLLGNLANNDLCNAMVAQEPPSVCRTNGSGEFSTFSCTESSLPPSWDTSAVAKRLSFRWIDGDGRDLGSDHYLFLDSMPTFPVHMKVENEWGRSEVATIRYPPKGVSCPDSADIAWQGLWVGASNGSSFGTRLWDRWVTDSRMKTLGGDFNGDGRTDVAKIDVTSHRPESGLYVGLSDGTRFRVRKWEEWTTNDAMKVLAGDFNGDGRSDVMKFDVSELGTARKGVWVGLSDGARFHTTQWDSWATNDRMKVLAGDFDADGRTDVMRFDVSEEAGFRALWVGLSDGTRFRTWMWDRWYTNEQMKVLAGDFNGDGRTDVMKFDVLDKDGGFRGLWVGLSNGSGFHTRQWGTWYTNERMKVLAGDFNGDGKSDVMKFDVTSDDTEEGLWVGLSNGSAFQVREWARWKTSEQMKVLAGDFNGDGLTDVMKFDVPAYGNGWSTLTVGLSDGQRFLTKSWSNWVVYRQMKIWSGDFDGNGRDDVMKFDVRVP